MDVNNRSAVQAQATQTQGAQNWRTQLPPDTRRRVIIKLVEALRTYPPVCGQFVLDDLKKLASKFEEKMYTDATSKEEYFQKISVGLRKFQDARTKIKSNAAASGGHYANSSGSDGKPSQVNIQVQQLGVPKVANQTHTEKPLLYQNRMASEAHGNPSQVNIQARQLAVPKVANQTHIEKPLLHQNHMASQPHCNPSQGNIQVQQLTVPKVANQTHTQKQLLHQNRMASQLHCNPSQVDIQAQKLAVPKVASRMHTEKPLLHQNPLASAGLQNCASLAPLFPPVRNITQATTPNLVDRSSNLQTLQNMPNGADWKEAIYQKIKTMKGMYLPRLINLHQIITFKLQQQPLPKEMEKFKMWKIGLEHMTGFLQLNKSDIQPSDGEKALQFEKKIRNILRLNRPDKPAPSLQQRQLAQAPMQPQQPQSLDGQTKPPMPPVQDSHLLADPTRLDGTHAYCSAAVSDKSSFEKPLEHLIKVVKRMSPNALNSAVSDISSVLSTADRIGGFATGNGSRSTFDEELVAMTKCHSQARDYCTQDGGSIGTTKLKRYTTCNVVSSSNGNFWQCNGSEESELESTERSSVKRTKLEANHALVEEIRSINRQLIDTFVEISDEGIDPSVLAAATEGGKGTTVKCSFTAVALSPDLKSDCASSQMFPIQPLRLLVPANYPDSSLILLDDFPCDVSKEHEDQSMETKSRFNVSLRSLSQPFSLKDIAITWDVCARAVVSDYAQKNGGGTFSSKYGSWDNCLSAV